jgi:hypothetical protein
MIPSVKKTLSITSFDSQVRKRHHKEKLAELSLVLKFLENGKKSSGSSSTNLSFHYFRWLNPLVVKSPNELKRRLEGVETLVDIDVKGHAISKAMISRLFFWAKIASPRVIFSRIGRLVIKSHERTKQFKRHYYLMKSLERRLKDTTLTNEERNQVEQLFKEEKKHVNQVITPLNKSMNKGIYSVEHDYQDDSIHLETTKTINTATKQKKQMPSLSLRKQKYASIIAYLQSLDKELDPSSLHEEIDNNLRSHPCFSLCKIAGYKTNVILSELIKRGCSLQQLVNGITIVLYDYEAVTNVFENFSKSTSFQEWKDHPFLLLNIVYQIESLIGFCKKDNLFGGAVLFSWNDIVDKKSQQKEKSNKK